MDDCSEDGCNRTVVARGWCHTHYARFRRAGKEGVPTKYLSKTGVCTLADCGKPHLAKGLCATHYNKLVKHGDALFARKEKQSRACGVEGCAKPYMALGYCGTHYQRSRHNGDPLKVAADVRREENGGILKKRYRYVSVGSKKVNGEWRSVTRLEHRVVMERVIGRPLLPNENVHHLNGDRFDNRPENLELWAKTQPCGQRVEDLVQWATEILARYGKPAAA